jgi:hypothetical protein
MNLKEKFSKNDGTNKVDEGQYRSLIGVFDVSYSNKI